MRSPSGFTLWQAAVVSTPPVCLLSNCARRSSRLLVPSSLLQPQQPVLSSMSWQNMNKGNSSGVMFVAVATAGKGVISGADFARSLVTAADVRHVDHLLDKVGAGRLLLHLFPCLPARLATAYVPALIDQVRQGNSSRQAHLNIACHVCHLVVACMHHSWRVSLCSATQV